MVVVVGGGGVTTELRLVGSMWGRSGGNMMMGSLRSRKDEESPAADGPDTNNKES